MSKRSKKHKKSRKKLDLEVDKVEEIPKPIGKIYFNTKKDLFLGKRKFSSKKMTENDFLSCINKFLLENGEEEISDLNKDSLWKAYYCIVDYYERYYEKHYKERFYGSIMYMNDMDDSKQLVFHNEDGFCYISLYTKENDYLNETYMYNILYFDENGQIQYYVPFYGNLVDIYSKSGLIVLGDEIEFYSVLKSKYTNYLNSKYDTTAEDFYDVNYYLVLLDCLGQEYGVEGNLPEAKKESGYVIDEDLVEALEVNEEYVREDILSNVEFVY